MENPKLCIDCRFYEKARRPWVLHEECWHSSSQRTSSVSLVDGRRTVKRAKCVEHRRNGPSINCGPSARFFISKRQGGTRVEEPTNLSSLYLLGVLFAMAAVVILWKTYT